MLSLALWPFLFLHYPEYIPLVPKQNPLKTSI
jgi:hypothetical protein